MQMCGLINSVEKILERARERQRKLCESSSDIRPLQEINTNESSSADKKIAHQETCTVPSNSPLKQTISEGNLTKVDKQITRISSDLNLSNKGHSNTFNIQNESFNMEIKLSSTENVRIEVEIQESDGGLEEKENINSQSSNSDDDKGSPPLREDSRKRLQRLGKLYSGGDEADISSPIHRTEANFLMNSPKREAKNKMHSKPADEPRDINRKGLGGLATLAQTINEWDDNLSKANIPTTKSTAVKKSWKPPAPQPPKQNSNQSTPTKSKSHKSPAPKPPVNAVDKLKVVLTDDKSPKNTQGFNLDPNVIETLESQGFTRTNSNTRLIYNYNSSLKEVTTKTSDSNAFTKISAKKDSITEENEEDCAMENQSKLETKITPNMLNKVASPLKTKKIADRAAKFESPCSSKRNSLARDPALMSVSERKALFEKNKGTPPVPKAPITSAAPKVADKLGKKQPDAKKTSTFTIKKSDKPIPLSKVITSSICSPVKNKQEVDSTYKVASGQPGGIASKVAALFKSESTISQQQIENNIREQRQKDLNILLHRFNKNKDVLNEIHSNVTENAFDSENCSEEEITEKTPMIVDQLMKNTEIVPSAPPLPGSTGKKRKSNGKRSNKEDSPKVTAILDDVKRIKVSSRPGRLYPCLSDIEATTEPETDLNTPSSSSNNSSLEDNKYSELEADDAETSFGREILETVCKKHQSQKRNYSDESYDSNPSDILDGEDDYLDEAAEFANSNGPTPRKQGRSISPVNDTQSSDSFLYKKCSPSKSTPLKEPLHDFKTPKKCSPRRSEEFPAILDGDTILPLTHTVSFYRKQTQQSSTPIKHIIKYPIVEDNTEECTTKNNSATTLKIDSQKKIKQLEKEIEVQCQTIHQTSRGLNWCNDNPEFMRSTEQVELERVLLLATHRRSAIQHEIDRLHVVGSDDLQSSVDTGDLAITNIVLPLKQEYIRALNATGGKGHHVVCLVECGEQVYATTLVATLASCDKNSDIEVEIPGTICLQKIPSTFTVKVEVYCLISQEEVVPHEVKYHIKKKATPKKTKHDATRLIRPPVESPGGPYVVRSSSFASMGYVIFDIQAINKKNWTLNNAPSKSPLRGSLEMRLKYNFHVNIEHRGFLNVLEYISDSNMWHRRWCVLRGHTLSYWKYPEDEKAKKPIDCVDLRHCCTKQIGPAPRQVSARLFTMMIEIMRPSKPEDKSTSLMMPDGEVTVIRHVVAADTKEERLEWTSIINKALTAIKINDIPK